MPSKRKSSSRCDDTATKSNIDPCENYPIDSPSSSDQTRTFQEPSPQPRQSRRTKKRHKRQPLDDITAVILNGSTEETHDNVAPSVVMGTVSDEELPPPPTLTRQNAYNASDVLLELLQTRVLVKPKIKRVRPPRSTSTKTRVQSQKVTAIPLPSWMSKKADLSDLVTILRHNHSTNSVYIDITDEAAPYNEYTLSIVRHLIRKARQYPSICSEWNVVTFSFPRKIIYSIPLNGRNADRGKSGQLRAFTAIACFSMMFPEQSDKITTNVLKDCGYGTAKASLFIKTWHEVESLNKSIIETVDSK